MASSFLLGNNLTVFAGRVVVWGRGTEGQANVPADLTNAVAIASGANHNVALRSDGTVAAWGLNDVGQASVPVGLSDIVGIGAGGNFSLAVRSDGTVVGWGSALAGLNTLSEVAAVSGGSTHLLALKRDGTVAAIGDNSYYQCAVPAGLSNVVQIAAGDWHSCALRSDGNVAVWGSSSGDHQTTVPQTGRGVNIVSCRNHGLVLTAEGLIYPWGDDDTARIIGYSIWPPTWYPAMGTGDGGVIGNGKLHFLAGSFAGNETYAWGWNAAGQLNVPAGLSNVVALSGGMYHSVALVGDGPPQLANRHLGLSLLPTNTIASSETITLHVAAVGAPPLTYYWLRNESNFTTTTLPRLYVTNVQPAEAGTYSVIVSNAFGTLRGSNQVLAVLPLKITSHPTSQTVFEAGAAAFTVAAVGTDLKYQWRHDNADLPGQTNVVLNLPQVATNDAGQYSVLVSNLYDVVISSNAQLTVNLPAITTNPTNRVVNSGDSTTFQVLAAGAALNYQWLFNDTTLPAATNAALTLSNVTSALGGAYRALVSNPFRVLESSNAMLTVVPLTILPQPTNRTVFSGESTTFVIGVQGNGPFSFQWRYGGGDLDGATNGTLTLSNLLSSQSGNYSVVVSNAYGTVASSNALLTVVDSAPTISIQPTNQGSYPGRSVTFRVTAIGSKPMFHQWLLNGSELDGATDSTLVLANLTETNIGVYSVRITNALGSVTSSNALLTFLSVVTWGTTNGYGLGSVPWDLTNVLAISAGANHSVALKSVGTVVAWGYNYFGQTTVPANLSNVMAIAAGGNHTLVLKSNGTVVSWGDLATVPSSLSNVVAVAAGTMHNLVLKSDGTCVAWGGTYAGNVTNVPAGLSNVVGIAAGGNFAAALKRDGAVVAWGSAPSTNGMTNIVTIAANDFPLVALKADGKVVASGVGTVPANWTNIVAVAAGRYHILGLKPDGTVTNLGGPTTPTGLTNVAIITSGQNHCLAIIGNGPPPNQVPMLDPKRGTGVFSVSLPTLSGRVYGLEYKNSLASPNWTALPLMSGNGSLLKLMDGTAIDSQRLYRVRQW